MKNAFFLILIIVSMFNTQAQSFFKNADSFLKENVINGLVNYDALVRNSENLESLANEIANFPIESADKKTQLAFYLNAYNILAIKNVIDNYPISSPLKVDGFFDKITNTVAGKNLTLNQIENDIIRPQFNDARIHFALVCVAKGCPQLSTTAFTSENVNTHLEKLTQQAMNNPNFIQYEGKTVLASEIFKWYIVDFGNTKQSVLDYINKYTNKDVSNFSLDYYPYNWELNKQ